MPGRDLRRNSINGPDGLASTPAHWVQDLQSAQDDVPNELARVAQGFGPYERCSPQARPGFDSRERPRLPFAALEKRAQLIQLEFVEIEAASANTVEPSRCGSG